MVFALLQVNTNGLLSFGQAINLQPQPFPISTDQLIIAPFWSNVDTRARGTVHYRTSSNTTQLEKATFVIQAAFPRDLRDFVPTSLVIVTWDDVGYYSHGNDLVS